MAFVLLVLMLAALSLGPAVGSAQSNGGESAPANPASAADPGDPADAPPRSIFGTGLYLPGSARGADAKVDPGNIAFSPHYPLWSDGATKHRWIHLPPGTSIDASRPDAWAFPPGTRLWKEFSFQGRRVETRLIERRANGSWRFLAYVWNLQDDDAALAPPQGTMLDIAQAPAGRYAIPSTEDCLACHEGAAVPVLGVSAVQLSTELNRLADLGLVRNLPTRWRTEPPSIEAASALERAALGYLHGNCGHCHNHNGAPAPVRLVLGQTAESPAESRIRVLSSAVDRRSRFRPPGLPDRPVVIAPGRPSASVLAWRMRSRHALVQMPPLGTLIPDEEGVALIERWIASYPTQPKESSP